MTLRRDEYRHRACPRLACEATGSGTFSHLVSVLRAVAVPDNLRDTDVENGPTGMPTNLRSPPFLRAITCSG